jgi:uncharacterized DUF497 family protein
MRFVWNENKNRTNLAKHGIEFALAATVFDDPRAISFPDRLVEGEQRWKSIGWAEGVPVVLSVAHTISEDGTGEVIRIISARKRLRPNGGFMKKSTNRTVTMTLDEVRKRMPSKSEAVQLKKLAALPDDQIDTTDIPELTDFAGGVRGRFYRPVTQSVTIRLNAPDVEAARQLSKLKGLPYQTYIKGLLHDALVREANSISGSEPKPRPRHS